MRKLATVLALFAVTFVFATTSASAQAGPNNKACWGQATKVFAQTGEMGAHSSQQENPRIGLANLARYLYAEGVIPEPTMEELGRFVSSSLGLSIDACVAD